MQIIKPEKSWIIISTVGMLKAINLKNITGMRVMKRLRCRNGLIRGMLQTQVRPAIRVSTPRMQLVLLKAKTRTKLPTKCTASTKGT